MLIQLDSGLEYKLSGDIFVKRLFVLNIDQRIVMKEKLKDELRKAIKKDNYFTKEESYLISNFIKKLQNELSIDKDN